MSTIERLSKLFPNKTYGTNVINKALSRARLNSVNGLYEIEQIANNCLLTFDDNKRWMFVTLVFDLSTANVLQIGMLK